MLTYLANRVDVIYSPSYIECSTLFCRHVFTTHFSNGKQVFILQEVIFGSNGARMIFIFVQNFPLLYRYTH